MAGRKKKEVYNEIIEWLEEHNGKLPRSVISKNGKPLVRNQITEEERKELKLRNRWDYSEEANLLIRYKGRTIDEVPYEYREKIENLRKYGLGKTVFEEMIEWLENHDGKMPKSCVRIDGKISRKGRTEEEIEELHLYRKWKESSEKKFLEKYNNTDIEDVPEVYRDKVRIYRQYLKKKTVYQEIVEWLKSHDGKMPRNYICVDGVRLRYDEITEEERKELKLHSKWEVSDEKLILHRYVDKDIEEVPEKYREKIRTLRELGVLGKTKDARIVKRMKDAVGRQVDKNNETREELRREISLNNSQEKEEVEEK